MLVRDMGEFRLIDTLAQVLSEGMRECVDKIGDRGFRLRLSIGDDAAAWDQPAGAAVLTTDTMVEGSHFDLSWARWRDLGWKSLAVNLSDVAAMGCAPTYAVVTLGLRGDLPVDGLVELYRGIMDACRECGGAIVGGDIVKSPVFFITVALQGAGPTPAEDGPPSRALLTRRAASAGDKIAVTGSLGCSAGGLRVLKEGLGIESETAGHLKDAFNRPMPRVRQGETLVRHGVLAAMDVSDGLMDDLGKLCKASGAGATVYADRLPVDGYLKAAFPNDWLELAVSGGEDYELLFTAPPDIMNRVTPSLGVPARVIGEIVDGAPHVTLLDPGGNIVPVARGGWDHFGRP